MLLWISNSNPRSNRKDRCLDKDCKSATEPSVSMLSYFSVNNKLTEWQGAQMQGQLYIIGIGTMGTGVAIIVVATVVASVVVSAVALIRN